MSNVFTLALVISYSLARWTRKLSILPGKVQWNRFLEISFRTYIPLPMYHLLTAHVCNLCVTYRILMLWIHNTGVCVCVLFGTITSVSSFFSIYFSLFPGCITSQKYQRATAACSRSYRGNNTTQHKTTHIQYYMYTAIKWVGFWFEIDDSWPAALHCHHSHNSRTPRACWHGKASVTEPRTLSLSLSLCFNKVDFDIAINSLTFGSWNAADRGNAKQKTTTTTNPNSIIKYFATAKHEHGSTLKCSSYWIKHIQLYLRFSFSFVYSSRMACEGMRSQRRIVCGAEPKMNQCNNKKIHRFATFRPSSRASSIGIA